jgi:uncharacterized protein (TIGR03086 family)
LFKTPLGQPNTVLRMHHFVDAAMAPTIAIVHGIRPEQLTNPTPCAEFDVQALLDHMMGYGPRLEAAARKLKTAPDPAPTLERQLARIADEWREPDPWVGEASMGGEPMPAAMLGGMILVEMVVHGWDLAMATGQPAEWPEELLRFIHDEIAKTATMGRDMGLYGPPVPVPDDAPLLDRTIALTGRDSSYWNRTFRSANMEA